MGRIAFADIAPVNRHAVLSQPQRIGHCRPAIGSRTVLSKLGENQESSDGRLIRACAVENDSRADLVRSPEDREELALEIDAYPDPARRNTGVVPPIFAVAQ